MAGSTDYKGLSPSALNKQGLSPSTDAGVSLIDGFSLLRRKFTGDATGKRRKILQLADLFSEKFIPRDPEWTWVETEVDGVYTTIDSDTREIWLRHAGEKWGGNPSQDRVLINGSAIDQQAPDDLFTKYYLSPDLKYIAVASQEEKGWRHSATCRYRIFDVQNPSRPVVVAPRLSEDSDQRYIAAFQWRPKGHDAVFVFRNDVYVITGNLSRVRQVTADGSTSVSNGVPDWVYEEEVYASNSAMWWSPDGRFLAYLKFNDTNVSAITIPFYSNGAIQDHSSILPPSDAPAVEDSPDSYADYPQYASVKYPKAGHTNPRVTLHIFHVADGATTAVDYYFTPADASMAKAMQTHPDDRIICDVVWGSSAALLVRFTNREQNIVATALCSLATPFSGPQAIARVVRLEPAGLDFGALAKRGDGGWYGTDVHPILALRNGSYVDRVVVDGFYHLALFATLDAASPSALLTRGPYDVDRALGMNPATGHLYYASRQLDSTASHIFSVHLPTGDHSHISDETIPKLRGVNAHGDELGHFEAVLSPGGGFLILSYLGPHVPYHLLVQNGDTHAALILETNSRLRNTIAEYDLPFPKFTRVSVNGTELNVMELLPPNPSKAKLRVLFSCYGGPESQDVARFFGVGFHAWLVSNLTDVAVVQVDNRGTGFRGRSFSTAVARQLGRLEAQDQLGAIAAYSNYSWVDPSHLGLWGWSFGGYLAAKTVEADNNHLLSAAAAVAPVSDWRFYDTIYTERYMGTPQNNPKGYAESAVKDGRNFNVTDFLFMHGTADDNVNLQNSLYLADLFSRQGITRPAFYTFPDNDHSMNSSYQALFMRLYEHFRDKL